MVDYTQADFSSHRKIKMIKQIDDELYGVLCSWWKLHGWTCMPRALLPKTGHVSFVEDKPVIAGFLYKMEDCCFGVIAWVVGNPESTSEERSIGFSELLESFKVKSKEMGIVGLWTSVPGGNNLVNRYLENGFKIADNEAKNLMCFL